MAQPLVFPNNIRAIREKKKMMMKDLAEGVGVSISTMSKIEKGVRKASDEQVREIAGKLHVRRDEIVVPLARGGKADKKAEAWLTAQRETILQAVQSGAAATAFVMTTLRKRNKLTLREVSAKLDLKLTVYHRVETASRLLRPEELKAAAALYHMKVSDLEEMIEKTTEEQNRAVKKGTPPEAFLPRVPKGLPADRYELIEQARSRMADRVNGRGSEHGEGSPAGGAKTKVGARVEAAARAATQSKDMARADVGLTSKVIPVYGEVQHGKFVIDRERVVDHVSFGGIPEIAACDFAVRVQSGRLGQFMRAGSLCFVQQGAAPGVGDTVLLVMKDKTAVPALYHLADGQVPAYKMFWPDETIPMDHPELDQVLKVRAAIFA
jgi:transcriptional regulator with XRE-family HTH domain